MMAGMLKSNMAKYRGYYCGKAMYVCPHCNMYIYETDDNACMHCGKEVHFYRCQISAKLDSDKAVSGSSNDNK